MSDSRKVPSEYETLTENIKMAEQALKVEGFHFDEDEKKSLQTWLAESKALMDTSEAELIAQNPELSLEDIRQYRDEAVKNLMLDYESDYKDVVDAALDYERQQSSKVTLQHAPVAPKSLEDRKLRDEKEIENVNKLFRQDQKDEIESDKKMLRHTQEYESKESQEEDRRIAARNYEIINKLNREINSINAVYEKSPNPRAYKRIEDMHSIIKELNNGKLRDDKQLKDRLKGKSESCTKYMEKYINEITKKMSEETKKEDLFEKTMSFLRKKF